jgi:signal transduction histidine kinase
MKTSRSRALLTAFALMFATLLVTAAIAYLNVRRLYEHDQLVDHTHVVMGELRLLLGAVADAESGMRGYVLSSDASYLKHYEAALVNVPAAIARIEKLTADDPDHRATLVALKRFVTRRMELMEQAIDATRDKGPEAGREEAAKAEGRDTMEAVRDLIRKMERAEAKLLSERVSEAAVGYWTAVVSSLITAAIGLVLAAIGFVMANRDIKVREQRTQELKELNDRLEERVRERTTAISEANAALREEIVERHRAEKTVRQVADELARSNHELAQFAAVASHDLQEPLRKIQAFGDRLFGQCHDEMSEKGREYLRRMLAAAARMQALIAGLLEYSRVSTRRQGLVSVDLGQTARDVVGDLEARLQQSGGAVEVGNLPTIAADPLQIRQLFQNLIGNALKFHRADAPPLVRVSGRIVPRPPAGDGDSQLGLVCELSVEDNGVGFEPAHAQKIFELFQRLHGRDEYEGTGMGLAICKKIAERHGGSIAAESAPGQGSRFTVTLPLVPPAPGETP